MRKGSLLLFGMLVLCWGMANPARSDKPIDKDLVKGNTRFALDLYGKLRGDKGNLFLSPYSISTALAMTYAGARNQTADDMARVLEFPRAQERLHPACAALMNSLRADGAAQGYQLNTANALWVQKDNGFRKEFLTTLQDNYGTGLREVDFGNQEGVRQDINNWTEKETKGKIKELLKQGILDGDTRFALTNAIYFKGNWISRFKKEQTREGDFRLTATEKVRVPLMHQQGGFKYVAGEGFQTVELPYVGKQLSLVVFLPKQPEGLAAFEQKLTPAKLAEWLAGMHGQDVKLTLPKFKITGEFRLDKTLSELGMGSAFSSEQADYSGMVESKRLFLKAVVHKAFVEVNEEGTETAAATVVTGGEESAPDVHTFNADHPFLFLIRDNRSGSILFLGRVMNPNG